MNGRTENGKIALQQSDRRKGQKYRTGKDGIRFEELLKNIASISCFGKSKKNVCNYKDTSRTL